MVRTSHKHIVSILTAVVRTDEQLEQLHKEMKDNRSQGLAKYKQQFDRAAAIEDTTTSKNIIYRTYENERELAAKV